MPVLDLLLRRADFRPTSLNRETRTVRVTVSTGAAVRRRGYIERLTLPDPQTIVGLPVLNAHRQDSLDHLVGRVTNAGRDAEGLWADIRISERADWLLADIEAGIITSASIGYAEARATETVDPTTRERIRTVEPTIREISLVPVPADAGARIRSQAMEDETGIIDPPAAEPTEAQTRAAIRQIARTAGLTAEQADDMIDRNLTVVEARAEAFEAMQTRTRNQPRIRVVASHDDPAALRTRREEALYARVSGTAPTDAARQYMGDSLRDHARACLETAGISTRGLTPDQLFERAMHTTSDFPQLLTGTGNRTLMASYQAAESPLKGLARQTTLPDFRTGTRLKLSGVGALQKVSESGEIKHTTRGEAKESFALDTYASMFALSRKALINDDLGAFTDWGRAAGRAAAETEANLLVSLLLQGSGKGPVMGEDNKRLFHADHGNLATTPGALGDAGITFDEARLALRRQKDLDGKTPISATPKFLLVSPEYETAAEQLLSAIYASDTADANVFAGRLTLLVEARFTGPAWYVFADPAVLPVLEYGYLSSAPGPQLATRPGWDVLGTEFRVVLDFGAGAVDFRGAYLNPGG
ncbi:prohead protease/major capsid protein fusion protein [Neorhizobium petrolearium]|uniref:prohead protease/major capsid protein fusion protein n=1 Tax=Neorhizobium petrolearium TaxID=515361 RepID=UPI003F13BDB4